jgi:hypothetical protein
MMSGFPNQPLALGAYGALFGTAWSDTDFRIDSAGTLALLPFSTPEDIWGTTSPLVQSGADCAPYGVVAQPGPNLTIDQTVYRLFEPGQLCQPTAPLRSHYLARRCSWPRCSASASPERAALPFEDIEDDVWTLGDLR